MYFYLKINGALAQLARALRWQRRGRQFESDMLHIYFKKSIQSCVISSNSLDIFSFSQG
jgi:hypothetical protein